MREIKFRGMSATGKMRYGRLSQDKPDETTYYKEFSQRICWDNSNNPVRNGTLGQYTGLKDKNGVEIYEGDICKDTHGISKIIVFKSMYGAYKFCNNYKNNPQIDCNSNGTWEMGYMSVTDRDTEIIGNIYKNPELLDIKTTLGK